MVSRLQHDPRIDPRIKKAFGELHLTPARDVSSREELLREELSPEAQARYASMFAMMETADSEDIAPSAGLRTFEQKVRSTPDGNHIGLRIVRPDTDERVACVYYTHGGAMQILSCFNGTYRAWSRMIAAHGVAVVMVDFRNCVLSSSVPEVAPYPAGLNDCLSGLRWLHANAAQFGIDPTRIVIAGESGGANLAIATALKLKRDGDLALLKGLYALCPYIAGQWPLPQNPSSIENNEILDDYHNNRGRMAYGIEAFLARDPLAWPGFATEEDVRGLPPVVISVNECDPFRDEGLGFYRLLLRAQVPARCSQIMGMTHGAQVFPLGVCLDISRDAASHIASFAKGSAGTEVVR
jgi:acetyl esterase